MGGKTSFFRPKNLSVNTWRSGPESVLLSVVVYLHVVKKAWKFYCNTKTFLAPSCLVSSSANRQFYSVTCHTIEPCKEKYSKIQLVINQRSENLKSKLHNTLLSFPPKNQWKSFPNSALYFLTFRILLHSWKAKSNIYVFLLCIPSVLQICDSPRSSQSAKQYFS